MVATLVTNNKNNIFSSAEMITKIVTTNHGIES
jgi:hypothetical protein